MEPAGKDKSNELVFALVQGVHGKSEAERKAFLEQFYEKHLAESEKKGTGLLGDLRARRCDRCNGPMDPSARVSEGFTGWTRFKCASCHRTVDVPGPITTARRVVFAIGGLIVGLYMTAATPFHEVKSMTLVAGLVWAAAFLCLAFYRRVTNPQLSGDEVKRAFVGRIDKSLRDAQTQAEARERAKAEERKREQARQEARQKEMAAVAAADPAIAGEATQGPSAATQQPSSQVGIEAKASVPVHRPKARGDKSAVAIGTLLLLFVAALGGAAYSVVSQLKHFLLSPALPVAYAMLLGWFAAEFAYGDRGGTLVRLSGTIAAGIVGLVSAWVVWLAIRLGGNLRVVSSSISLFGIWDGLGFALSAIAEKTTYFSRSGSGGYSGSSLVGMWWIEAWIMALGPVVPVEIAKGLRR